jgi:hypothetical protein
MSAYSLFFVARIAMDQTKLSQIRQREGSPFDTNLGALLESEWWLCLGDAVREPLAA